MESVTLRATLTTSSKDERLCVVGTGAVLGDWKPGHAVLLTPLNDTEFEVTLHAHLPLEYKYVLMDVTKPLLFKWEDGSNRVLHPNVRFVSDPLQAWGVKFRQWESYEPGSLDLKHPAYEQGYHKHVYGFAPPASGVVPSAEQLMGTGVRKSEGALSTITAVSSGENSPIVSARAQDAASASLQQNDDESEEAEALQAAPETAPEETSGMAAEDAPETVPGGAFQAAPEETPEIAPVDAPESAPEVSSQTAPDDVPMGAPEETPGIAMEDAAETTSKENPEIAPEKVPEKVPETTEQGDEEGMERGLYEAAKAKDMFMEETPIQAIICETLGAAEQMPVPAAMMETLVTSENITGAAPGVGVDEKERTGMQAEKSSSPGGKNYSVEKSPAHEESTEGRSTSGTVAAVCIAAGAAVIILTSFLRGQPKFMDNPV